MNNLMDRKWPRNSANISTYQYNNSKITQKKKKKKKHSRWKTRIRYFQEGGIEKVRIADAKTCLPTGKLV